METKARCCVCGRELPNRWAVGARDVVSGEERLYCQLHAKGGAPVATDDACGKKEVQMEANAKTTPAQENEAVRLAPIERVRKAWTECRDLALQIGGAAKALFAKISPDHSPETMLAALNGDLAANRERLAVLKPELDEVYRAIVTKKAEYQKAAPARQRLLKIELQTLMARYKGLEREFALLCENERSIETVKGRFLELLAHDRRGKLSVDVIDELADKVDDKTDEAEELQDALGDLERSGQRSERDEGDFDAELAAFDGELGLSDNDNDNDTTLNKENLHEDENTAAGGDRVRSRADA